MVWRSCEITPLFLADTCLSIYDRSVAVLKGINRKTTPSSRQGSRVRAASPRLSSRGLRVRLGAVRRMYVTRGSGDRAVSATKRQNGGGASR